MICMAWLRLGEAIRSGKTHRAIGGFDLPADFSL
jgi:hypothetical protein